MKFYELLDGPLKQRALDWWEKLNENHFAALRFSRQQGGSVTKIVRRGRELVLVFDDPSKVDTTVWKRLGTDREGDAVYRPYRRRRNRALLAQMKKLDEPVFNPAAELGLQQIEIGEHGAYVSRVQTVVKDGRVLIAVPDDYKPVKSLKSISVAEAKELGVIK